MNDSTNHHFVEICSTADVPADGPRYLIHNDRPYAVVRAADAKLTVMDDTCPHAGASLSGGGVHEGCLVCPWHGWAFDIDSGECPDNPAIKVRTYETKVANGKVWARLP